MPGGTMVHDFHDDLRDSMGPGGDRRTESILKEFFANAPDFYVDWSPREIPYGHDLEVTAFGERYTIEEKRRRVDYGDELLEDVSNDQTHSLGWTRKCSDVDYVLHVYAERWVILPGPTLYLAFANWRRRWIDRYGERRAANRGYHTINVPVPTQDLYEALEAEGSAPCEHCGRPLGRFVVKCSEAPACEVASCCVVTDGEWRCPHHQELGETGT